MAKNNPAANVAPPAAPPVAPFVPPAPPVTDTASIPASDLASMVASEAPAKVFKFKIDDDIPLPTRKAGTKGESIYPYNDINIGQSFFVPPSDRMAEPWKTITSLTSRVAGELWPKRFKTAHLTEDGIEGVRVWRIADGEGAKPEKKPSNRKPKVEGGVTAPTEAERLAAEAVAGDTSNKALPPPDFE